MNTEAIEALAELLSIKLEMPVVAAHQPSGADPLSSRPPRPYVAVAPSVSPAVGQVQHYIDSEAEERTMVQDYEPHITFQVFHHTDFDANLSARKLKIMMATLEAQLLMQTHKFAYMREAGLVDNTQVRHHSWSGRADLDLVFSSSTSYTEAVEMIEGFSAEFSMKTPDGSFTVQVEEEA